MLSDNISTVNKTKKYFTAISGIIKPRTLNIGTSIKCDQLIDLSSVTVNGEH